MLCCRKDDSSSADEMTSHRTVEMDDLMKQEKESRYFLHPGDSQIALSTHIPLYPPGRIIHVVRSHPKKSK